ncbi:hypothetical protein ACFC58_40085 [Kitasatospora purpeofusca]|uniref:hypothetical protein n=1 Tax=Kitasatospora purpeofusca TaxID=67352 RepID=UPI0035E1613C
MSKGGDVPRGQPEEVGPGPWLALACLVGLLLAYLVLTNLTGELRAALWGEPGTVTGVDCRTYDNGTGAGSSTSCSGTFTADDGGPPFDIPVAGRVGSQSARAWLVDGTSGVAYVSPAVWTGVFPVGLALVLAGLPAALMVAYVRHARAQRAGAAREAEVRNGSDAVCDGS